jgi:LEA14-like dessication related protein
MKGLFTWSVVLLFCGAIAAFAQPKLEFVGGDTYDWGEVTPKDSPLKAKVLLKNAGNQVLIIKEVKPTCGCTIAPISKDTLKPGETAEMSVQLNMKTYQGSVTKTIKIATNDPKNENARYYLKCFVKQPLIANPKFLNFRNLELNQLAVTHTTVSNTTDKPIKITDVSFSKEVENLQVNVTKGTVIPPKGKINIEATYTPGNEDRLTSTLRLKTDSEEQPVFSVSVWGHHNKAKSSPKKKD